MTALLLKRASASRPSGEWNEDDFDVLAEGAVVGRIFKATASPVSMPWMWTLAFGHHDDRSPTYGYAESTGAMRKSWRKSRGGSPADDSYDQDRRGACSRYISRERDRERDV
jgi:hypothetical protein